ncbi:MAG: chloride channel protein [Oscillospiraceae bacterium]|jgi:H+/Cl- antiporter ClcA|nr:chloride channel protein [Oscillospiraceae bacterium]
MSETKQNNLKVKSQILFLLIAVLLGAVVGAIIWLFLTVLNTGIDFLWRTLPEHYGFTGYTVLICVLGGFIIGLWSKKFGAYPDDFEDVITKVKETGRYNPQKVAPLFVAALLPLLFGGSLGPEAGLVGVVAALCTWVGNRFKSVLKEIKELTEVGISASLSILFVAPLFGLMEQVEGESENLTFPNRKKIIVYFAAISSGIGIFLLLISLFGGGMHIERFGAAQVSQFELMLFVPLAILGALLGGLYNLLGKSLQYATQPLKRFPIISSVLGGLLIGICGMFLPLVMLSGESQIGEVMADWTNMSPVFLFLVGFFKLLVINICLNTGWRGGHIIPVIFAGICFGFGIALITGVDSVFAAAVVTTALCGAVMRKPIAVVMIMFICFPVENILILSCASFAGACIPMIKSKYKENNA